MTETLHHPVSSESEQLERYAKQLATLKKIREQNETPADIEEFQIPVESEATEAHEDTRETSPMAGRVRAAAERFAARLEKRAISRAHNDALKEYRDRDHSDYVDHVASLADDDTNSEAQAFNRNLLRKEERRSDREEFIEDATLQLRALGGLGLEKAVNVSKDAGLIAVGLGAMGYEAAANRARGALLKHEMKAENRRFRKDYAKETKQFDKTASKEAKKLGKLDAKEMRSAKKEDRKFERGMRRKVTVEKWESRAQKAGDTYRATKETAKAKKEATIVHLENGARRTGEAYRTTKESYETAKTSAAEKKQKLGAFAVKARSAGQAAVAAGREEFKK